MQAAHIRDRKARIDKLRNAVRAAMEAASSTAREAAKSAIWSDAVSDDEVRAAAGCDGRTVSRLDQQALPVIHCRKAQTEQHGAGPYHPRCCKCRHILVTNLFPIESSSRFECDLASHSLSQPES